MRGREAQRRGEARLCRGSRGARGVKSVRVGGGSGRGTPRPNRRSDAGGAYFPNRSRMAETRSVVACSFGSPQITVSPPHSATTARSGTLSGV